MLSNRRLLLVAVVLLFLPTTSVLSLSLIIESSERRKVLQDGIGAVMATLTSRTTTTATTTMTGLLGGGVVAASCWSCCPESVNAVRGAAELDLEYYARDLLSGNRPGGSVSPSKPPPPSPPRTIREPLLSILLNNECSIQCFSTQALVEQKLIKASASNNRLDRKQMETSIEREIQDRMEYYRSRSSRSFYARTPWTKEDVSDQYYFDLTSYSLWRTAADLLPDYVDRDRFVRSVGRRIYHKLTSLGLVLPNGSTGKEEDGGSSGLLLSSNARVMAIMDVFSKMQFCKGYRLGELDTKNKKNEKDTAQKQRPLFDELDDQALSSGASVDALISVFEPVTLGASLQITGERSRFAPDFIGPTLAAMWEGDVATSTKGVSGGGPGIQSYWETFFVDPTYRPNPKDYFPDEQLFQFTLTGAT